MEELNLLLLQSAASSFLESPAFLFISLGLVMYLFFIRPQNQKQKEQISFSDSITKGDEIVTTSGVLGKVTKVDDRIVTLEISPKNYMQVTRTAISKELTDEVYKKEEKK